MTSDNPPKGEYRQFAEALNELRDAIKYELIRGMAWLERHINRLNAYLESLKKENRHDQR